MIVSFKRLAGRTSGVAAALCATTVFALCLLAAMVWTDFSHRSGNRVYDQFLQWMGFTPPTEVVVVAIDAQSRERLGPWPLSRAHYARLLQRVNTPEARPRAIGLDLLFQDARPEDDVLAAQMNRGLPVVLPQIMVKSVDAAPVTGENSAAESWRLPLPVFARASAGLGHIHVRYDSDGMMRGVQPDLLGVPHFSLALLRAGGQEPARVLVDDNYLRFRIVDPRVGFTTISLVDALDPSFQLPDLKGKFLLLGVTDPTLGDQHATIYSGSAAAGTPGVFLIASMLSADLQKQWIRTVPPWLVFCVTAVSLLLLQWGFYRLRPRRAVAWAVGATLASLSFSYGLLTWFNWWFNVVPGLITLVLLLLFWAWYSLEGVVNFMWRKSAELDGSSSATAVAAHASVAGSVVDRYADRLDRAIDLQGEQLTLLGQILSHIPDGVAVLDVHDKVLLVNQAFRRLVTLDQDVSHWNLADLQKRLNLPPTGWPELQTFASEQSDAVRELPSPTGASYVYMSAASVQKSGAPTLRLLTLTDVTELRRSQTQRDQALSFLSHDMRTPVASILALTQQLHQAMQGQVSEVQMVGRVSGHADQLMRLMDGFLIESRAHGQHLQRSERLLDDLMEDAVAQAQDLARLRAMPLVVVTSETFFFVQVNSQLMVRALLNVLMNAIKYGEPGTPIELLTREVGTADRPLVEIEVSNLVAWHPANVDKDMLTQGFGLGLDLVQTVLRRHDGTARLDIPPKGVARVVLTLPCVPDNGS